MESWFRRVRDGQPAKPPARLEPFPELILSMGLKSAIVETLRRAQIRALLPVAVDRALAPFRRALRGRP
jgi:hypothetical protein